MNIYDYCNAAMYISLTVIVCSLLLWATGYILVNMFKCIINVFRRE